MLKSITYSLILNKCEIMNVVILGGSGAIGTALSRLYGDSGARVFVLDSKNCDLMNMDGPSKYSLNLKCDILINAAGTFGGLKSYEQGGMASNDIYLKNLEELFKKLLPSELINISSAALLNESNFDRNSAYYEYCSFKKRIEDVVSSSNVPSISNIRCTNIISRYENFIRSGHSIASIYKKFLVGGKSIEIWSHPEDWREYLDADDLARFIVHSSREEGLSFHAIGSGRKIHMHSVVDCFKQLFAYNGEIVFSQPHKDGPVGYVVGIPEEEKVKGFSVTPFDCSIDSCYREWASG